MNPDESKNALRLLGGLFPNQVTQEIGRLLREDFKSMEFATASEAIKEHRRTRDFLNIPQLLEGCRAVVRGSQEKSNTSQKEGSWCDVYRRQNPQLREAKDYEVILRVHRNWWHRCPQTEIWHRKLQRECRNHLEVVGMDSQSAGPWADAIFSDPDIFSLSLSQLRGDLAMAM